MGKGGLTEGHSHDDGGNDCPVKGSTKSYELEKGEVIVPVISVECPVQRTYQGTNKDILSQMIVQGGGNPLSGTTGTTMAKGGIVKPIKSDFSEIYEMATSSDFEEIAIARKAYAKLSSDEKRAMQKWMADDLDDYTPSKARHDLERLLVSKKMKTGGEVDLFEDSENIPPNIQAIMSKYELEDNDYIVLEGMKQEMEAEGYTFEYDLGATPYNLRKMAKGGEIVISKNKFFSGKEGEDAYAEYVNIYKRMQKPMDDYYDFVQKMARKGILEDEYYNRTIAISSDQDDIKNYLEYKLAEARKEEIKKIPVPPKPEPKKKSVRELVEQWAKDITAHQAEEFPSQYGEKGYREYIFSEGKKYYKVKEVMKGETRGSTFAFIEKETGDIYKPASATAPAKGIRASIYENPPLDQGQLYRYRKTGGPIESTEELLYDVEYKKTPKSKWVSAVDKPLTHDDAAEVIRMLKTTYPQVRFSNPNKYKLGDKWNSDFDYDGMLELGHNSKASWGKAKLQKLFNSFEDVNYATEGQYLGLATEAFPDKKEVKEHLDSFHKVLVDRYPYLLHPEKMHTGGTVETNRLVRLPSLEVAIDPETYTAFPMDYSGNILYDEDYAEHISDMNMYQSTKYASPSDKSKFETLLVESRGLNWRSPIQMETGGDVQIKMF